LISLQQAEGAGLVVSSLVVLTWLLAVWAVVMPANNAAVNVSTAKFLVKVFIVICDVICGVV
jgi:hypothetical protein